jgi:hypothetical protein
MRARVPGQKARHLATLLGLIPFIFVLAAGGLYASQNCGGNWLRESFVFPVSCSFESARYGGS